LENENKAPLGKLNPAVFVVLTLAVIFLGYQIIGGFISLALTGPDIGNQIKDIKSFRVVVSFSQFMFILAPVVLLNILKGDDFRSTFRLNPPDYKIFILSIIGILAIQPFLQLYIVLQNKLIFSLPFGSCSCSSSEYPQG